MFFGLSEEDEEVVVRSARDRRPCTVHSGRRMDGDVLLDRSTIALLQLPVCRDGMMERPSWPKQRGRQPE
jgi:hypothetical protein